MPIARDPILEKYVHPYPIVKQIMLKLLNLIGTLPLLPYAQVIAVEEKTGKILHCWEDPRGETLSLVSTAVPKDGYLYFGSFQNKFIARMKLTN